MSGGTVGAGQPSLGAQFPSVSPPLVGQGQGGHPHHIQASEKLRSWPESRRQAAFIKPKGQHKEDPGVPVTLLDLRGKSGPLCLFPIFGGGVTHQNEFMMCILKSELRPYTHDKHWQQKLDRHVPEDIFTFPRTLLEVTGHTDGTRAHWRQDKKIFRIGIVGDKTVNELPTASLHPDDPVPQIATCDSGLKVGTGSDTGSDGAGHVSDNSSPKAAAAHAAGAAQPNPAMVAPHTGPLHAPSASAHATTSPLNAPTKPHSSTIPAPTTHTAPHGSQESVQPLPALPQRKQQQQAEQQQQEEREQGEAQRGGQWLQRHQKACKDKEAAEQVAAEEEKMKDEKGRVMMTLLEQHTHLRDFVIPYVERRMPDLVQRFKDDEARLVAQFKATRTELLEVLARRQAALAGIRKAEDEMRKLCGEI